MKTSFLTKISLLISVTIFAVALVATSASATELGDVQVVEVYQAVDLDRFIAANPPLKSGKRVIVKPKGIKIQAQLMASPEEKEIKYAYTALMMMNIDPLPDIRHRLFIRSAAGKVIAVYATAQGAKKILDELKVGEKVQFSGYHIYNYRLGPAIVIEDFIRS